jgi:hypothetical protein
MSLVRVRSFTLAVLLSLMQGLPAITRAADDDLVVVDEGDLGAYWNADERRAQSLLPKGEGGERYGCFAMPFVIEPDGRVSPGTTPLLVKMGADTAVTIGQMSAELYPMAMGTLPPMRPTWDKAPASAIYSSRSVVVMDARIRQRLGEDRSAALHEALERACRIQGLAAWRQRNDGKTVEQSLPARTEDFLSRPNPN